MRSPMAPWLAVVLAVALLVAVSLTLLTVAVVLLYAGAPPWLVALAVAGSGWGVYAGAQRLRQFRTKP